MSVRRIDRQLALRAAAPLLCWAAVAAAPSVSAQGKDDLWEITSRMEVVGMPMAMPGQTIRQCVAKGGKDEDYVPRRENCKVLESKRTGNTIAFKMACTGKDAMTATGETTMSGSGYEGWMQMAMKMEGQDMQMKQTYSGKRVGDCTAK
jgi:hypothetical protein